MKAAIECLPAKLQTMGETGRQRVLELHHPARQAEQLRTLFFDAVESKRLRKHAALSRTSATKIDDAGDCGRHAAYN